MGFLKDARGQAAADKQAREGARRALDAPHPPLGVQYRTDTLRETLIGDKVSDQALTGLLNHRAAEGWAFRQAVPVSVKGRVGPGGTDGLLVIFERPS